MEQPKTNPLICPRCGFAGSSGTECSQCGVIFAKYRQHTAATQTDQTPAPASRGVTLLPWILALVAVVAIAISIDAMREEPVVTEVSSAAADAEAADPLDQLPESETPPPTEPIPTTEPSELPLWEATELVETEPASLRPAERPMTTSFTWYEGASGFKRGVEEAQREGKAMAVYFYTDWCPYCRELESELLSRAKVEDYLKYLVKIRVNPEKGSRERMLADEYGVNGYPSFFIQPAPDAPARKIRRTDSDGLKSPEEFVATLERAVDS